MQVQPMPQNQSDENLLAEIAWKPFNGALYAMMGQDRGLAPDSVLTQRGRPSIEIFDLVQTGHDGRKSLNCHLGTFR